MCGIYGFSGHRPVDQTKLRWLAKENMSRGQDSTGVASGHTIFKKAVKATDFINLAGFTSTIKGKKVIQGHTRAKTMGAVNDQNAHPFTHGIDEWLVIGSHNGVLHGDHNTIGKEQFGIERVGEVDSQLIFAAIAAKKDITIVNKIAGSIACAFQIPNHDPDKLYLYRNGEYRPLHIGQASDGIYYSSEAAPLHYIGCDQVWQIDAHKIYTLKNGEIIDVIAIDEPVEYAYNQKKSKTQWTDHRRGRADEKEGVMGGDTCSIDNQRRLSQNNREKNYSTLAKVDGAISALGRDTEKLLMMIKQCEQDVKLMNIEPLHSILSTKAYNYDDNNSCLLLIKIVDSVKKNPLIGWGVWMKDNVEFSGITSISGCTLIKIPYAQIPQGGAPLSFVLYDPIEFLEPKEFEVVPQAASFMEVELSIPFREKDGEEGGIDIVTKQRKETGTKRVRKEDSVHSSSSKSGELYDEHTKQNQSVLRRGDKKSTELCGPRPEGALDEHTARQEQSSKTANSTSDQSLDDLERFGANKQLIKRSDVIKNIVCNAFKPKNKTLFSKEMADKDKILLRVKYSKQLGKECTVDKLFLHATMLRVYDLETRHVAKPIENYVHEIVTTCPYHYITLEAMKQGKSSYTNWLPKNVIKAAEGKSAVDIIQGIADAITPTPVAKQLDLNLEEPIFVPVTSYDEITFKKNLCFRDYTKFIGFRAKMQVTTRLIENKMVIIHKEAAVINNLKAYHRQQNNLLNEIRTLMAEETKTTPEVLKYREVLQKVRNLMIQDATDVHDYIDVLEANKAVEEKKQKNLAST